MTLDDRYSAWLDGELSDEEVGPLEAELAADPELAAEFEGLRSVRDLVRAEAMVAMRPGSLDRIVAAVETDTTAADAAPADITDAPSRATVVPLAGRRRRVPTFAAVAASFVIIVSVVGGLGGSTTLPAVGDLIARHDAAASDLSTDDPDDMDDMGDMPAMPGAMAMTHADVEGNLVHAVYSAPSGSMVSVFRQDGDLDVEELVDEMNGGDTGEMDGFAMWGKDIGERHVTVVDGDGYVWTIVSDLDAPMDDMMDDVMADLPSRSPGVRERLHDVAEAIVEPFGLGF